MSADWGEYEDFGEGGTNDHLDERPPEDEEQEQEGTETLGITPRPIDTHSGAKVGDIICITYAAHCWRVMLKGSRKVREGETILAGDEGSEPVSLRLMAHLGDGYWNVAVDRSEPSEVILDRIGHRR